jgi:hypothetical protein
MKAAAPAAAAALLPTRAEIIRLTIASARGDKALLREMIKCDRAGKARARRAIKAIKKDVHLNGKAGPTKNTGKKDEHSILWPVLLAAIALHS